MAGRRGHLVPPTLSYARLTCDDGRTHRHATCLLWIYVLITILPPNLTRPEIGVYRCEPGRRASRRIPPPHQEVRIPNEHSSDLLAE